MSEEVKRVGRDLAYEGTVIKVYKDHMKFANGNTAEWDFIHHDGESLELNALPENWRRRRDIVQRILNG